MKALATIVCVSLAFSFFGFSSLAGEILRPERMVPEKEIPGRFLKLAKENYEAQVISSSIYQPRSVRLSELEFFKRNHFWINNLVLNGNVLFGNEASLYVEQVAHKLLATSPEIKAEMKFYVINSPHVNAFATDMGVVFINVGLLAHLENEAQLAFILAHEITHYLRKHNLNSHLEEYKIKKELDQYKRTDPAEKVLSQHLFSRELEEEADIQGLFLYLETKYNTKAIDQTFDILQKSDLPFAEVDLDPAWFTIGKKTPETDLFKVEVAAFDADEEDDTFSTHPSVSKRRKKMEESLEEGDGGTQDFLVSEATFKRVRANARKQLPRLYLMADNPVAAIYNAMLMDSKYAEYKDLTTAKAILRYYQTGGKIKTEDKRRYQDHSIYQLENILYDYKGSDLYVLGWQKAYDLAQANPEDPEAVALARFYAMVYEKDLALSKQKKIRKKVKENLSETIWDKWLAVGKEEVPASEDKGSIVLTPNILILDFKKEYPLDYLKAEEYALEFSRNIETKSAEAGTKNIMLQPKFFNPSESQRLDDYGVLRNFLFASISMSEKHLFPTDFMEIEKIKNAYGVSNVKWNYVISSEDFRNNNFIVVYFAIVTSFMIVPIPFWLYRFATPSKRTFMASFEVDLSTKETRLIDIDTKNSGLGKGKLKKIAKNTVSDN